MVPVLFLKALIKVFWEEKPDCWAIDFKVKVLLPP
jgi:hypothetical protein